MRYAKFGLALALLSAGCSFKDGEILAAICKKAGEKISNMSGNAPAHLTNSVRDSMGEASLAARAEPHSLGPLHRRGQREGPHHGGGNGDPTRQRAEPGHQAARARYGEIHGGRAESRG